MVARARFYREVSVQSENGAHRVLLDGKAIRTPGGHELALPGRLLADAIAEEWRAQDKTIRPETMILTRLANTAIDRVGGNRHAVIAQILAFSKTDLVCYRAEAPQDLIDLQAATWDPLLAWARERYRAGLQAVAGIKFVEQPPAALAMLKGAIAAQDDFALAALHSAATLTRSTIIALALSQRRLDAAQAFDAAELEQAYQAKRWGYDPEALTRSRRNAQELTDMERFFALLRR